MFKNDIKVNYSTLEQIVGTLEKYQKALQDIRDSINKIEKIVQQGKGLTMDGLVKKSSDFKDNLDDTKEEVEELLELFKGYNTDMRAIISPVNTKNMMRVDRNDVYWNKESIIGACQAISLIPYTISTYNYDFTLNDSAEEKARKKRNSEKLSQIKKILTDSRNNFDKKVYLMNEYYKKIQKYEDMDDTYESKAKKVKDKYTDFWDGFTQWWKKLFEQCKGLIEGIFNGIKDFFVGLVELGKGIICYTAATCVCAFDRIMHQEDPKWAEDYVKKGNALIGAVLDDPVIIVEALAQGASDAIEEKGIEYGVGYTIGMVGTAIVGDKGLSKVLGKGSKAAGAIDKGAGYADDVTRAAATGADGVGEIAVETFESLIKAGKVSIKDLEHMGLTSVEELTKMGVDSAEMLAKVGVGSVDDLIRLGITSVDDLDRLGLTSAEALKKIGVTDVNQLVEKGIVSESDLVRFGLKNVSKTISNADRAKINGWDYTPSDELYLKYKEVYDNPLYYDQKTGRIHWPVDDGFKPGTKIEKEIAQDTIFKRYGENSGEFLGNAKDSFESRALAPHSEGVEVHYYQLTEKCKMTTGEAAPWFGSDGGAEQFVKYKPDGSKYTIKELEDAGILEDITDLVKKGEIKID